MSEELVGELRDVVGAEHVLVDADVMSAYVVDWSRRFSGPALAVVRPADTAEVAEVVRRCAAAGVPMIPQGGNTGLVGGSVPGPQPQPGSGADRLATTSLGGRPALATTSLGDGPALATDLPGGGPGLATADSAGGRLPVVVSTRRLTRLDPVDDLSGQVTVGAGVTLADLQAHAKAARWEYGVDLAARDSATVGGTIGTNAGGIRVCCHGMTRRQVVGLEAVLPDGSVLRRLGGLPKDNTGYDLTGLFVGSEGTLGIVTAARLQLVRPATASSVALVAVHDAADALTLVRNAVPTGVRLLAAEILDAAMLRHVVEISGLPMPVGDYVPHVLLIETESAERGDVELHLPDDRDAVVAVDAADKAQLWSYRERAAEAASAIGVPHRFDVSVPLGGWDAFVADMKGRLTEVPDVAEVLVFGHLADGNLHVEVIGPRPDDERADDVVLHCVADHHGSISAEHGVGRAKASYLHLSRSATEIATMRAIKAALDPHDLFNPGALLG